MLFMLKKKIYSNPFGLAFETVAKIFATITSLEATFFQVSWATFLFGEVHSTALFGTKKSQFVVVATCITLVQRQLSRFREASQIFPAPRLPLVHVPYWSSSDQATACPPKCHQMFQSNLFLTNYHDFSPPSDIFQIN